MRRHALPLLAVVAVSALTACGSDDSPAVEGPFPQITTTTSTTTQATAAPALKLPTPKEAATHLYEAWKKTDRPSALQAATPAAVDALFAHPFKQGALRGCDEPTSLGADCVYAYERQAVKMHITGDATNGFVVQTAEIA